MESTRKTLDYLQNLNHLFENGFLCHEKLDSLGHPVLARVQKGFGYFTAWLDSLLKEGVIPVVLGGSKERGRGQARGIPHKIQQLCPKSRNSR